MKAHYSLDQYCRQHSHHGMSLLGILLLGTLWLAATGGSIHAQVTCPNPYIVQPGDGWYKIANKCGVSYPVLVEANRALWERQGETLYVGDQLQMPSTPLPTRPPIYTPISTPLSTPVSTTRNSRGNRPALLDSRDQWHPHRRFSHGLRLFCPVVTECFTLSHLCRWLCCH